MSSRRRLVMGVLQPRLLGSAPFCNSETWSQPMCPELNLLTKRGAQITEDTENCSHES